MLLVLNACETLEGADLRLPAVPVVIAMSDTIADAAASLCAQYTGLLDNIWLLIVFYASTNLPIAVWMTRSFLAEVPVEMLEGLDRRRGPAADPARDRGPGRPARNRRDVADLLHLRLERVAVRPGPHREVATTAPVFVTSQGLSLGAVEEHDCLRIGRRPLR